jgi:hypothetical protein
MPRDGAIIFSDLIGKLDVLRVTCATTEKPPPLPRAALFYFFRLMALSANFAVARTARRLGSASNTARQRGAALA